MTNKKFVKGAEPFFGKYKKNILKDIDYCLTTGNLSSGKFVNKFEKDLKNYFKSNFALSVSSGGIALELAIIALGLKGKEIIVPTQTFIASPNAIVKAGAKPIFCDVDINTGCLDPKKVIKKITKKTGAIMFVHMFGIMTDDIFKIKSLCKKKKIYLIEDASHAHGAKLNGLYAGNIGDVGCFSLYATKIMTTGEGGFILTNNKKVFEEIKSLKNYGKNDKDQKFYKLSNNFRLSEISAILGIYQLKMLNKFIEHRNNVAKIYFNKLKNVTYLKFFKNSSSATNSFWRYPIYLSKEVNKKKFQFHMLKKLIRITWMYEPLCHLQPLYNNKKQKFEVSERHINQLINLPTHLKITKKIAAKISISVINSIDEITQKKNFNNRRK